MVSSVVKGVGKWLFLCIVDRVEGFKLVGVFGNGNLVICKCFITGEFLNKLWNIYIREYYVNYKNDVLDK